MHATWDKATRNAEAHKMRRVIIADIEAGGRPTVDGRRVSRAWAREWVLAYDDDRTLVTTETLVRVGWERDATTPGGHDE
jgi:hypothetical protein|tara:strand:- start:238 stop:477 length:240 start_codon:yes stop_codon:yes gene_type:complete